MISGEDRKVLAFIAGQQLVLGAHVRALLRADEADADARLAALVAGSLDEDLLVLVSSTALQISNILIRRGPQIVL